MMIKKQIAVVRNAMAKVKASKAQKKAAKAAARASKSKKTGGSALLGALIFVAIAVAMAFALIMIALPVHAGTANPPTAVILTTHGEPDDGTDSVQSLTFDENITGGTFRLRFGIKVTAPISWSNVNDTLCAHVQSALWQLSNVGVDGAHVSDAGGMSSGHGTANVVFDGPKTAKLAVPQLAVYSNSLTGSTHDVTPAVVDEGVTADGRAFGPGALCIDIDTLKFYVNNGEKVNVDWQPEATPAPGPTPTPPVAQILGTATFTPGGSGATNVTMTGICAILSRGSTGYYTIDFSAAQPNLAYVVHVSSGSPHHMVNNKYLDHLALQFTNASNVPEDHSQPVNVTILR